MRKSNNIAPTETGIIERVQNRFAAAGLRRAPWLAIGAGDDAAVLRSSSRNLETVLSCDWFLEGVHFAPEIHSAEDIGYKALARATSDLAAMGARPKLFLLSLALPKKRTGKWLDGFVAGLESGAREFGMVLAGGDTSKFPRVVASLTVGGEVRRGHELTRSGARTGDQIFVSGTLGAAQFGLGLLLKEVVPTGRAMRSPKWASMLNAHLRPKPQIVLGRWLAGEGHGGGRIASAAIDTSDGLSTDLAHLCEASGCGARIWAAELPVVEPSKRAFERLGKARRKPSVLIGIDGTPLEWALHGGEDYELLFTVSKRMAGRVPREFRGVGLSHIGEIVRGSKIELIGADGKRSRLLPGGWDSFAR